jgi:hypothetical protein
MDPVTSVIENIYVKISWLAPDNNGSEILTYRVLLLASDTITWLESEYCQYDDTGLLADMSCYVPMAELTSSKYSLPYNRFISIKVQAYNYRGWGPLSQANIVGVNAETVPVKM